MKKNKKIFIGITAFLLFALIGIFLFSPYGKHEGFSYKLIMNSIEINAPVDSVYTYLGNSKNAAGWSVFVDHINPINIADVSDGTIGSKRKCYCNRDETGQQWKEEITEVIPGKKRQLAIYDLKDFFLTADHLATEQIYERVGEYKTKLTFTLFFKDHDPGFFESLKMYVAAYKAKSIFEKNMENIKRINEQRLK